MFLQKKHGGCSIGDAVWVEDGAVAEVPDSVGADLLALAPDEYEQVDAPETRDGEGDTESDDGGDLRQPNKAASAEDWKAYALAQGLPQDVVDTASRKAIVDHFTGGPTLIQE